METQSKKRAQIVSPFSLQSASSEYKAELPIIMMESDAESQVRKSERHMASGELAAEFQAIAMEVAAERTLERERKGATQSQKEWAAVRLAMALLSNAEAARARWCNFKRNEEYNSVLLAAEAMAAQWTSDSKTP